MPRVILCTLALLIASGLVQAQAPAAPGITVVGSGYYRAAPDVAFVTLYVRGNSQLASDAAQDCDEKTAKVVKALRTGHGETITAIDVRDFYLGPSISQLNMMAAGGSEPPPIAIKQIVVTAKPDAPKLHALLDTAARGGAALYADAYLNNWNVAKAVSFGLREHDEASRKATEAAVIDARQKASILAAALERTVGAPTAVTTQSSAGTLYGFGQRDPLDLYGGVTHLSDTPEEVVVRVDLIVTFALGD